MATSRVPTPPLPNGGAESSSKTDFKVLNCSHTWTINNFSHCWMKPGEELNSPTFSSETDDKIKWCVSLYPGGRNEEDKDYVSLYLTLVSSYKAEIRVKYKFYVLNDKREKTNLYDSVEAVTYLQKSDDDKPGYGRIKFISRSFLMDKANGLLSDDNLTIFCEISASTIIPSTPTPNGNVLQADQWGSTQVKLVKFSYMWTISNFSFCTEETGQQMGSPTFSAGTNSKFKWQLYLYPKGQSEKYKEYLSVYLHPGTSNKTDVKATYTFCIINSKREKTNEKLRTEPCTFVKGTTTGDGFLSFVKRDFLLNKANELLPDDKLTIFCEISYVADVISVSGESKPIELKMPECRLSDDLEILLEKQKLSDITLVVREKELRAHKAILAARSPVFSAMFEHDMEERRLNRVEITDIDYEVLRETLWFIYTGKAKQVSGMASALLTAADKYDLEKLKVICEQALCLKLGIENAADMLIFADEHNAEQLKAQTVNFINAHAKEVMDSERFKSMFVSHPELIAEVAIQRMLALKKNDDSSELLLFDKEQKSS